MGPGEPGDSAFPRLLRAVSLIGVVAGAAGSVGLMLRAGYRDGSAIPVVLLILFSGWVLSPYMGLVLADIVSKRWSYLTRATLQGLMVIVSLCSLAIYGNVAFSPPRPQPAFMFLVVPSGSWLLMITVVPIAAFLSRRQGRGGAP